MNAMAHILVYLLEASVAAVVFYLIIKMLMSNETCLGYIRVLWLGAIVLSVAMPFLRIPLPASVQFKVDEMHENILGGITAGEMEFTAVQPVHLPPVVQPGLMAHPVFSPPGPRVLCRQHGAAQRGRCEGIPEIIDKEDCGSGFLHGRQQLQSQ